MTVEALHDKLVAHIVRKDRQDQARAARAGRHFNHYALAHMLGAAQEVKDDALAVGGGQEAWVEAVMDHFTATRPMHTFLKKIDPRVDVVRGRWVRRP